MMGWKDSHNQPAPTETTDKWKRLNNKHSLYTTMLVLFMRKSQAYKICQEIGNHKKWLLRFEK